MIFLLLTKAESEVESNYFGEVFKMLYSNFGKPFGLSYHTFLMLIAALFIISIIYSIVRSFVYFFIVRPRDPELYHEYRADRRASWISNSIDRNTNERQSERYDHLNDYNHWNNY